MASSSVVPLRRDYLLTGIPVPSIEGLMELMTSVQPVEMPILDITIPSRIIKSIMEDCHVRSILECTTREAVTALL